MVIARYGINPLVPDSAPLSPSIGPAMEKQFADSILLLVVLLNPFLMSAYLHNMMSDLSARVFFSVLLRAFLISGIVFCLFAVGGDQLFSRVLQVKFASFLVFGGIVFLIIALRYIVSGVKMIEDLRGPPEYLAGSLAMPFLIGPGTVSASVLIGNHLTVPMAFLAIVCAMVISCLFIMLTKLLFDYVKTRNEAIVQRYLEISGRVAALLVGTIAVDMIMRGVELWQQGGSQF